MEPTQVHQVLHGYRNGHSLLASSAPLSASEELAILKRSDLTGPIMAPGFDEYLTGYTLLDSGRYAFAKTWYANEIARPGAVWTHTLLVTFADLGAITDLASLDSLFSRPSTTADFTTYKQPLFLTGDRTPTSRDEGAAALRSVLAALYSMPGDQATLAVPSPRTIEKALMDAWSQQWPRLRRAFQFCTGMMTQNAAFDKFDLLVGPPGWQRRQTPSSPPSESHGPEKAGWVDTAVSDIKMSGGPLRAFLHQFGAETDRGRGAFKPLVELYTSTRSSPIPNYSRSLSILQELGPTRADLARLKANVLAKTPRVEAEVELLATIASQSSEAVDMASLELPERARSVAKTAPRQAIELVRRLLHASTSQAETLIREVAIELQGSDLALREEDYAVALALIGVRPSYAAEEWAWSSDPVKQRQVIEVLRRTPELQPQVARAVAGRLIKFDAPLTHEAASVLGSSVTYEVLDRLTDGTSVSPQWLNLAISRSEDVRSWLSHATHITPASARVVALSLPPNDPQVASHLALLVTAAGSSPVQADDTVAMFLFLAARANDRELAPRIVGSTFGDLHKRAAESSLSEPAWHLALRHLPHLSWWRDWDTCEKLRRSVADRYIEGNWPAISLVRTLREPEVFRQILEYMRDSKVGRKAIEWLGEEVANQRVPVEPAIREVLIDAGAARRRDFRDD